MRNLILFLALLGGAGCSAGEFVKVPPPDYLPYHDIARKLGVCSVLNVDFSREEWRCAACRKMQPAYSWLVWVEDNTKPGDSIEKIMVDARRGAFNGNKSGWCIDCAPKLEQGWEPRRAAWIIRRKKWDAKIKAGVIKIGTGTFTNLGIIEPGQTVTVEAVITH
jgi:hypothetical protein